MMAVVSSELFPVPIQGIPEELPDGQPIPTNTLENQLDK